MTKETKTLVTLTVAVPLLLIASLFVGPADISAGDVLAALTGSNMPATTRYIVTEVRLPQALTAAVCGAALAVCGLLLQNIFRNPLADPSVFGISSGAAAGVAVVMLLLGGSTASMGIGGMGATIGAAFVGAMTVTAIMTALSLAVRGNAALLIMGLMIGYVASALITVLNYFATADGVKSYLMWGMGNFSNVSMDKMAWMAVPVCAAMITAIALSKQLDLMQLGDNYATALGADTRRIRYGVLLLTGFITAVTTAFCGPVAFIGLAVPHISRLLLHTDRHAVLLPATIATGAVTAIACNAACSLPGGGGMLPVNAITPLVGAPVVIYIILRKRK